MTLHCPGRRAFHKPQPGERILVVYKRAGDTGTRLSGIDGFFARETEHYLFIDEPNGGRRRRVLKRMVRSIDSLEGAFRTEGE